MILRPIGWPSARASVICLFREHTESSWMWKKQADERAGLSTDGVWIMAGCPSGNWHKFAGFSGN